MNTKIHMTSIAAFAIFAGRTYAEPATPAPAPRGSSIQTQLRIDVDKDVDKLHLISTTNDPDILTKTYILKNADPYEVKPYLRTAVRAERIEGDSTKVEAIKFNDGTGALIVSAEDYRFEKQSDGSMGIDELVESLDKPDLKSSSGKKAFAYFPKYWDANSLAGIIRNVGLNVQGDDFELEGGADTVGVDADLNALLFYCPKYQVKNIKTMLELYDTPTAEVKVRYAVYELDSENDDKLGVDFQAWKNGPGADIFSAAGRFSDGWSGNATSGLPDGTSSGSTKFFKFSPRWNTRYIDFLAANGKANVVTTGEISIMNGIEGRITNIVEIPRIENGDDISNIVSADYITLENQNFVTAGAGAVADSYRITASTENGALVTTDDFDGSIVISRVSDGNRFTYFMKVASGGPMILKDGKAVTQARCFNLVLEQGVQARNLNDGSDVANTGAAVTAMPTDWVAVENWRADKNMTIYRSATRNTVSSSYGFDLSILPSVTELTSTMTITMTNTSLLGFSSDGTARLSASSVNTRMSVPNSGARLVVGGVEKTTVVQSVSKLPWLGDLPGLGWLLSSESQSSKKTRLVAILDCTPVTPDQKLPQSVISASSESEKFAEASAEGNLPGFDQLIIDKEKKTLDPLP
ncbi:MAG TPA: hypothetical protein PK821_03600 [Victivallales bacterium]|nr:hypothetical protein [Victivallales bacterium]